MFPISLSSWLISFHFISFQSAFASFYCHTNVLLHLLLLHITNAKMYAICFGLSLLLYMSNVFALLAGEPNCVKRCAGGRKLNILRAKFTPKVKAINSNCLILFLHPQTRGTRALLSQSVYCIYVPDCVSTFGSCAVGFVRVNSWLPQLCYISYGEWFTTGFTDFSNALR